MKGVTKMRTLSELLSNCLVRMLHFKRRTDRLPLVREAFDTLGIEYSLDLLIEPVDVSKLTTDEYGLMAEKKPTLSLAKTKAICMEQAIKADKPLLFLEDDVVFHPRIAEKMEAVLAELPDDWRVFYFGWGETRLSPDLEPLIQQRQVDVVKFSTIRRLRFPVLNHALYIRCKQCLTELSQYITAPATYHKGNISASDMAIALYFIENNIPMYGANPILAAQANGWSDRVQKGIRHRPLKIEQL